MAKTASGQIERGVKTARQRLEQIAGGRQSGATANRGGVKAALVKSGARFDAPPRFAGACFLSCRFDAPPRCARAGLGHGASRRFDAPPRFARNGRFWRTQKSSGVGELFEKLSEKLSGQLFVIGELFEKLFGKFSEELFVIAKLFEKLFGKFSGKLFAIGELSEVLSEKLSGKLFAIGDLSEKLSEKLSGKLSGKLSESGELSEKLSEEFSGKLFKGRKVFSRKTFREVGFPKNLSESFTAN